MATRVTTSQLLGHFMDNTSAHGIRKLKERTHWCTKLIWLFLLLGAACLIAFQLWQLIALYLRRPVTTKTTVSSHGLAFPSVTLCNHNPFKYSLIRQQPYAIEYIQFLADSLDVSLAQFGGNVSSTLNSDAWLKKENISVSEFLHNAPDEFRVESLIYLGETSDLFQVAHPLKELIVGCMFAGRECDYRNFSKHYDIDYLTCYQFPSNNNNSNMSQPPEVFIAGQMFGLSLILNVDQRDYLPFVTPSAGVRVSVHEYGTSPNLLQKGQSVSPGFETSIGIKPVIRIRLPEPHGNCKQQTKYSDIQECQRICLEENIETQCGCIRRLDNIKDNSTICARTDIRCVKTVITAAQEGNITCMDCRVPCREHSYTQRVSMTLWPATNYEPALRAVLNTSVGNIDTRNSLLSLKIFFSELTEETIVDEPAYEWESLVSDIGGQLGLFLGISILSLCELLELIFLILGNSCRGRSETTRVMDIQQPNE